MSVRNLAAPCAAPVVSVGRMIETTGNLRSRKTVGSGMIRLVEKSSPPKGGLLRSGKLKPVVVSGLFIDENDHARRDHAPANQVLQPGVNARSAAPRPAPVPPSAHPRP